MTTPQSDLGSILGASLEQTRDQVFESARTFPAPGELLVDGLSEDEQVRFLIAINL